MQYKICFSCLVSYVLYIKILIELKIIAEGYYITAKEKLRYEREGSGYVQSWRSRGIQARRFLMILVHQ